MAAAVRAAQSALGVPRRGRRFGQRLRASRRFYLRDPWADGPDQRRGGAGHGGGTRDRACHQPPLGAADQQGPAGPARARHRKHSSSDIASSGSWPSAGLSLLFLKYSRDAENQADQAGFRYALEQNYDVREMPKVFQTLGRISETGGGGKLPEWLCHPPRSREPDQAHREDARHGHAGSEQTQRQPRTVPSPRSRG